MFYEAKCKNPFSISFEYVALGSFDGICSDQIQVEAGCEGEALSELS
jgi:hypothetical protein